MARQTNRPILHLPLSDADRLLETAAAAGLVFSFLLIALFWARLPAVVPTHFGASGRADAWGPKETLLVLPLVVLPLLYILLTALSRYPWIYNYQVPITEENAERQYRIALSMMRWMKLEMVWLFVFLEWETVEAGISGAKRLNPWFVPGLAAGIVLIFGVVAYHLIQAYRAR